MGDDGFWKLEWLVSNSKKRFKALSEDESHFLLMGYVYSTFVMLLFLALM